MGNAQTKIYDRVATVLPGSDQWKEWCDKSDSKSDYQDRVKDREQFIHAIITVISQNGQRDLSEHTFRLLYARRNANDRLVARIVAEKEGVIVAKIESDGDGKDQKEAFRELRLHVERQLDRILLNVPQYFPKANTTAAGGSSVDANSANVPVSRQTNTNNGPVDAPPTYGNIMRDQKKG